MLLRDRYLVKKFFAKGKFGKFYIAIDTQIHSNGAATHPEVIVKISKHLEMNRKEFYILEALNKSMEPNS